MKTQFTRRYVVVSILLAAAIAFSGSLAGLARATPQDPASMAALGDSITTAYNTGSSSFRDAPGNSWSTGASLSTSLYRRFLARPGSTINGQNFNYAVTGAKMSSLLTQANRVGNAELVTVLMGANDVCTSSESSMTTVAVFETQFRAAMQVLAGPSAPSNRVVYVVSIPRVKTLFEVLRYNGSARFTWWLFGICQSMLRNPLSNSSTDSQRRDRVDARNVAFNNTLRTVCAEYGSRCLFDNNVAYNYPFAASDISTRDYFHPSLTGQATLAREAWNEYRRQVGP